MTFSIVMKKTLFLFVLFIICTSTLSQLSPIKSQSERVDLKDLEKSTSIEIIVFNKDSSIFQEKMEIYGKNDTLGNFSIAVPFLWPYDINTSEYSTFPYNNWQPINEDNIVYIHTDEINESFNNLPLPSPYLWCPTYPLIPHIKFQGTLQPNKTNGFAVKQENPSGLIEEDNGIYTLFFKGLTEGETKHVEIKIQREVNEFLFVNSKLNVLSAEPLFATTPYDPEYSVYKWEKDFLTGYINGTKHDVTINSLDISYKYNIPFEEYAYFIIETTLVILFGIALGFLIERKLSKRFPEK